MASSRGLAGIALLSLLVAGLVEGLAFIGHRLGNEWDVYFAPFATGGLIGGGALAAMFVHDEAAHGQRFAIRRGFVQFAVPTVVYALLSICVQNPLSNLLMPSIIEATAFSLPAYIAAWALASLPIAASLVAVGASARRVRVALALLWLPIAGLMTGLVYIGGQLFIRDILGREWLAGLAALATGVYIGGGALAATFVRGEAAHGRRFAIKWGFVHFAVATVAYSLVEICVRSPLANLLIHSWNAAGHFGINGWHSLALWALALLPIAASLVAIGATARRMQAGWAITSSSQDREANRERREA